ncbi:MAG: STAS domain-containing protein [Phycisphaerae bacterium]
MGIENWSEDIVLVDLPPEPQIGDELNTVTEVVQDRSDCDVILDFSRVDIVTTSSLSKLQKLRKSLADCGHQLVFCSAAPATKGILTATGLDGIFELVDDKSVALATLQMVT